jgi:hypothetical protein
MRTTFLFALLLLNQSHVLMADMIVDFGGEYVLSDQPLRGNVGLGTGVDLDGDGADDSIGGSVFTTALPFSPSSGYSGISSTFYGGAILGQQDFTGTVTFGDADVKNQGPNDSPHFHAQGGGHLHDLHAVFLWQQEDFLNGGLPFVFDSNSFVKVNFSSTNSEDIKTAQFRVIVRDDLNNYWLSQTAFTDIKTNTTLLWNSTNQGFSSSTDGHWASYNPDAVLSGSSTAGTDLRFNQSSASFSEKKFSALTAVGFYLDQDTFHNNVDFHFEQFQVNAASVPEPASLVHLSLVAILAASRFRRKSKLKTVKQ